MDTTLVLESVLHNVTSTMDSISTSIPTLITTTASVEVSPLSGAALISHAALSMGPHAAKQWMRYSNQTVADKVPEEMLHLVDPHWYQYPPMHHIWHKTLGIVMIVIGILGWTGNGCVVYIFLITPSLRTPNNILVVNLAFSDFLMMVIMSPPMVVNCWFETWILGEFFFLNTYCSLFIIFNYFRNTDV